MIAEMVASSMIFSKMNCPKLNFTPVTMEYSNNAIALRILELWVVGNQLQIPNLNRTLYFTVNNDADSLDSCPHELHFPPVISLRTSSMYSKPSSNTSSSISVGKSGNLLINFGENSTNHPLTKTF